MKEFLLKKYKTDWNEILLWFQDVLYYSWATPIINLYTKINRMLFWGWNMRNSVDYDASTLYDVVYLKLDRVYDSMLNYNHLVWNSSPDTKLMRRLCELKLLAKKLSESDKYNSNYSKLSDKYARVSRDGLDRLFYSFNLHPNAKTINDKLYSHFFRSAIKKDTAARNIDKNRYYYLMDKYLEHFWD